MFDMDALTKLVEVLRKLPGVGRRSSQRMAVKIVRDRGLASELIVAVREAKENLASCSNCGVLTSVEKNPCAFCTSASRGTGQLCVVEEPDDIGAIESSGGYHGRYHALMGKISPMKGGSPSDLRIKNLLERIDKEKITEVILALSTDVEGDSTASYIAEQLKTKGTKISRLAFGLPAGSGIGYSDPVTLARAMTNRTGAI